METSVAHREEYVCRQKPFKMGKHEYDSIVAVFSPSVLARIRFLSLTVLIDANFRPVFKMLKEIGKLRGEQHRVAEVPQNRLLLTE